jgi:Ser-tRNA(Ala) deacylase AlaX
MADFLFEPATYLLPSRQLTAHGKEVAAVEACSDPKSRGPFKVSLRDTVFHPQGGGQPSDIGVISIDKEGENVCRLEVSFVQFNASTSLYDHYGAFSLGTIDCIKREGFVNLAVDEAARQIHSRLHSAGHALDAAMNQLGFLSIFAPAKGYHFKDGPYVEYACKGGQEITQTSLPDAAALTAVMRNLIESSVPSSIQFLSREAASELCGCDLTSYPEVVRIVTIAGNICPCGGSLVENTSQLTDVVVTKLRYK